VAGAQPKDAVLQPPAVVERHGNLAPRVTAAGRARHPVDALLGVHCQPVLEASLVE
jgi:hypothetical protein